MIEMTVTMSVEEYEVLKSQQDLFMSCNKDFIELKEQIIDLVVEKEFLKSPRYIYEQIERAMISEHKLKELIYGVADGSVELYLR